MSYVTKAVSTIKLPPLLVPSEKRWLAGTAVASDSVHHNVQHGRLLVRHTGNSSALPDTHHNYTPPLPPLTVWLWGMTSANPVPTGFFQS